VPDFVVVGGGPVEKAPVGQLFGTVRADATQQPGQQFRKRVLLLLQIGVVAAVEVEVALADDPPAGVTRNIVHPLVFRGVVAHEVETLRHQPRFAEHRQDGADFGVEVAHPDQPVAFDPVVDVLLTVEVDGVGGHLPDAVQPGVVGFERAAVLPVAVDRGGGDAGQHHLGCVGGDFEPDETERGFAEENLPETRNRKRLLMNRVVLRRFPQRFGDRFAEGDAHPRELHPAGIQRQQPVQLDPEVEDELAARRHAAGARIEVYEALRMSLPDQRGGIGHSAQLPDHPDRRHDPADPVVRNGIGINKLSHDPHLSVFRRYSIKV